MIDIEKQKKLLNSNRTLFLVWGVVILFILSERYQDIPTLIPMELCALSAIPFFIYARNKIKQGDFARAGWVTLIAMGISVTAVVQFSRGDTWVMGMAMSFAGALLVGQMLPNSDQAKGILLAVIFCAVIILSDVLFQDTFSLGLNETVIIIGLISLVFLFQIFRSYFEFSIGAKVLMITILILEISLGATILVIYLLLIGNQETGLLLFTGGLSPEEIMRNIFLVGSIALVIGSTAVILAIGLITRRINMISETMKEIAQDGQTLILDLPRQKDESWALTNSMNELSRYIMELSEIATRITNGDLTVETEPRSEHDLLGIAHQKMVQNLRDLIRSVKNSSNQLNQSSSLLEKSSQSASHTVAQISTVIQQVAESNQEQVISISDTSVQVDQLTNEIMGVSTGAEKQSQAITSASDLTSKINMSVLTVSENSKAGKASAEQTTTSANTGSEKVSDNLKVMELIKEKVDLSVDKVKLMGKNPKRLGRFWLR